MSEDIVQNEELQTQIGENMRYGEKILSEFDVSRDLEIWENKHEREYLIKIILPEFCCLCPRSGYPDFATINLEYIPNKFVVELKAIKLYINSFKNRNISHEDSINEIYDVLFKRLNPKYMKIVAVFNPRGNVHTTIEISSQSLIKLDKKTEDGAKSNTLSFDNMNNLKSIDNRKAGAKRISERDSKKDSSNSRNKINFKGSKDKNFSDEKPRKMANKEGFRKISFEGDKKPRVVKKDR
ncbi:preQ(1) synthase [Campylobacter anatolicus]|nr:preQ(1) synthase [Campylobacter anatolicus]